MTKTEHYQLNQWDPEDPVRRIDFNEDNAKLDAVMNDLETRKAAFVKLVEVEVAEKTTELTIDVSGIDWSKWHEVHMDLDLTGSGYMCLLPNSSTSSVYYSSGGMSYDSMAGMLQAALIYGQRVTFCSCRAPWRYIKVKTIGGYGGSNHCTFEDFKNLVLKAYSSTAYMNPGSKITLWGHA